MEEEFIYTKNLKTFGFSYTKTPLPPHLASGRSHLSNAKTVLEYIEFHFIGCYKNIDGS